MEWDTVNIIGLRKETDLFLKRTLITLVWTHVEKRSNDEIVEKTDKIRIEWNRKKGVKAIEKVDRDYKGKYAERAVYVRDKKEYKNIDSWLHLREIKAKICRRRKSILKLLNGFRTSDLSNENIRIQNLDAKPFCPYNTD